MSEKERFPQLVIDLGALRHNVEFVTGRCAEKGITVAGVVKGTSGLPECIKQFADGGCGQIASSRLEQIETARMMDLKQPLLLLRVPMLSEVEDVVRLCDISLNSELTVVRALNDEAARRGKVHQVILMADVGDLREGYWDKDEMVEAAYEIETGMDNIELLGVGTNVGCYGSVLPTKEKLEELVDVAERVEKRIGRRLKYISGGATSSFMRVIDGDIPERINHLRIGEGILNAYDLDKIYHYDMSMMRQDVYTLRAEIVEVKDKPSHPVGKLGVDAFGKVQHYVDRGIRRKAIAAVGKADFASTDEIFPKMKGVEVLGGSSDHTILDITDAEQDIKVGDVLDFGIDYASTIFLTTSKNIHIVYK